MNKRKGFTLIELLAVIVILGLLMAIAIPSVTKYITQSRKKTVVSTIGNYIGALVNDVNDLTYTFTESNTVYAVPIECIALERGGTNPFGAWHQSNDAYWAYVLVQYDDNTSSYTYGYTFKDSAGYGLYPTAQSKLNEQGKQIQTGLDLKRPKTGMVTSTTITNNWNGFIVNDTTKLVVLEAESEGNIGDGKTTCTLQQKGDNYDKIEQEKENSKPEILTIKIAGTNYQFEEGMTWGEWINSKYNTGGFYVNGNNAGIMKNGIYTKLAYDCLAVYENEIDADVVDSNYSITINHKIFKDVTYNVANRSSSVVFWCNGPCRLEEPYYVLIDNNDNATYIKN